jgi:hypothetical protein
MALIKTVAYVRRPAGCIQLSHCKSVSFDADGFMDSVSDQVFVFDYFYLGIAASTRSAVVALVERWIMEHPFSRLRSRAAGPAAGVVAAR